MMREYRCGNLGVTRKLFFLAIFLIIIALGEQTLFGQRVALDCPVCYYDTYQMHEYFYSPDGKQRFPNPVYLRLFKAIEEKRQNDPSIKDQIRQALLGQWYTLYLQLAYTVEGGVMNPFKGGNYAKCELGCFPEILYFGKVYTNICITRICTEGRIVGTPRFCDPKVGPDIYIHYLTFWCQDVPRATMICGPSAHCEQRSDGTFLCEYNKVGKSSGDNTLGLNYVLIAPADASEPIKVAAFYNGVLIASRPVNAEGPIDAAQAYMFAQSTGLTEVVALLLNRQQCTPGNQLPSFLGTSKGGTVIVDPR